MPVFTLLNDIFLKPKSLACLTLPWLPCALRTKSSLLTMALQILCELTLGPLSNTVILYFIEQYCEIFYLLAYAVSSAWNILCLPDLKPAVFSLRKPSLTSPAPD